MISCRDYFGYKVYHYNIKQFLIKEAETQNVASLLTARNELITSLLAKCPLEEESIELGRQFLMDKRGKGVPIIIDESEKLAGKSPVYRLIDDTELMLTIFSAATPNQFSTIIDM
jgi:hypothetical protein